MKLVAQDTFDVEAECEELRHGRRKNFINERRHFHGFLPAWQVDWQTERMYFQLTIHREALQGSPVSGFAVGRVMPLPFGVTGTVIESIGVHPNARGNGLGVLMHEWLLRTTGVPLVAAHVQTPDGRDLWLRSLDHMKRISLYAVIAHQQRIKIAGRADLLDLNLFDGSESTLLMEKLLNGITVKRHQRSIVEAK